jgi:hypothetical protein
MHDNDTREQDAANSTICRLEWIAQAIEAARRYKESEHAVRKVRKEPSPAADESA